METKELKKFSKEALDLNVFSSNWLKYAIATVLGDFLVFFILLIAGLSFAILPVGIFFLFLGFLCYGVVEYGLEIGALEKYRNQKDIKVSCVFNGFKSDLSKKMGITFKMILYLILWYLLFIIPGIVKTFSYALTYLIHYDHPEYSIDECIKESCILMKGNKGRLFSLYLSFIGWAILGALTGGILYPWIIAHINMATAVLYEDILNKQNLIDEKEDNFIENNEIMNN